MWILCQQNDLIYMRSSSFCTMIELLFTKEMMAELQSMGPLGKVVNPENIIFSILRILITPAYPPWTGQPECGLVKPQYPPPQIWKSQHGCQGFMLLVHNVRQPVLRCGDGVSVEHMVHCFHARCNGATPVLQFGEACGRSSWVPDGNYPPAGKQTNYYYLQTLVHTNSDTHCLG